jgi:hypothetical protein
MSSSRNHLTPNSVITRAAVCSASVSMSWKLLLPTNVSRAFRTLP